MVMKLVLAVYLLHFKDSCFVHLFTPFLRHPVLYVPVHIHTCMYKHAIGGLVEGLDGGGGRD